MSTTSTTYGCDAVTSSTDRPHSPGASRRALTEIIDRALHKDPSRATMAVGWGDAQRTAAFDLRSPRANARRRNFGIAPRRSLLVIPAW